MRTSLAKLVALLLVLTVALTGCSMIQVNQAELTKDETAATVKKLADAVVAEYDGGTVTQADAQLDYNSMLNYYYQFYTSYFGTGLTQDMVDQLKDDTVQSAVSNRAILAQLDARGLSLDEDALKAEAAESYKSYYDSTFASAEGKTDEEKEANTLLSMAQYGVSEETLYQAERAEHATELVRENVEAEIEDVSDEDVKALYDEKVSDAETTYTDNPGQYGTDASNDTTVYFVPEGYRSVKHILIAPEDDVLTAMNDARDAVTTAQGELDSLYDELNALEDAEEEAEEAVEGENVEEALAEDEAAEEEAAEDEAAEEEAAEEETAEEDTEATEAEEAEAVRTKDTVQADIDAKIEEISSLQEAASAAEQAMLDSIKDTVDEVYAKLDAGESFDDVMAEFGTDPGMQNEPGKTDGYAICADSTNMVSEFVAGSMALENVGDWSKEPVVSTYGAHIIYYNADIPSGAVDYESVKDTVHDEALENARSEHYDAELESWIAALNPVYKTENWVDEF
ncbi:MAG: hypothetical protein E7317_04755 [Clostridiales bacterium]|nr:hypothetical protein [Clostridiales bacterium]